MWFKIKSDLEGIYEVLRKRVQPTKSRQPSWQRLALMIIKDLAIEKNKQANIFALCKRDPAKAFWAYEQCKIRNKYSVLYFFKLYFKY